MFHSTLEENTNRAAVELKWKEWWQPAQAPKLEEVHPEEPSAREGHKLQDSKSSHEKQEEKLNPKERKQHDKVQPEESEYTPQESSNRRSK